MFLILDNLRVHHSKPVKAWALQNAQKIELFYLPSYSSELNPEERLNADLKHAITSKVPIPTKAKLRELQQMVFLAIQSAFFKNITPGGDFALKAPGGIGRAGGWQSKHGYAQVLRMSGMLEALAPVVRNRLQVRAKRFER